MLSELRERVLEANLELVKKNLIIYTWGNVSGIDREKGLVVIKPSGVSYDNMKASDMVVVDLEGNIVEGKYKPSSDTATHLEIYKNFQEVGGVVHTHSTWATIFSQAHRSIPAFGTTHADYFYGDIPCTRNLCSEEIGGPYEENTGKLIVETFKEKNIDPNCMPGVLVSCHGPFTWGATPDKAVHNAVVLEELAKMAFNTIELNEKATKIDRDLLDKHFKRKHGKDAYYGQGEG